MFDKCSRPTLATYLLVPHFLCSLSRGPSYFLPQFSFWALLSQSSTGEEKGKEDDLNPSIRFTLILGALVPLLRLRIIPQLAVRVIEMARVGVVEQHLLVRPVEAVALIKLPPFHSSCSLCWGLASRLLHILLCCRACRCCDGPSRSLGIRSWLRSSSSARWRRLCVVCRRSITRVTNCSECNKRKHCTCQ